MFLTLGTPRTQFDRFPACLTGRRQSPIDINEPIQLDPSAKITLSDSWKIPMRKLILLNTGHKREFANYIN